jgi:hypothetical protein
MVPPVRPLVRQPLDLSLNVGLAAADELFMVPALVLLLAAGRFLLASFGLLALALGVLPVAVSSGL